MSLALLISTLSMIWAFLYGGPIVFSLCVLAMAFVIIAGYYSEGQEKPSLESLQAKSKELEEQLGLDLTTTAIIAENDRVSREIELALNPPPLSQSALAVLRYRCQYCGERWGGHHRADCQISVSLMATKHEDNCYNCYLCNHPELP